MNEHEHDDEQPQPAPAAICGESMMTGEWAPASDEIPDRQPASSEEEQ